MPPLDDAGMSIVARPPVADPPRGSRAGDEPAIGIPPPLGALLPTGGSAPAPAPTPRRALALDALRLLHRSRSGTKDDPADAALVRGVESVRRDLAPIHSRDALVASFAREAFRVLGVTADPHGAAAGGPGPVRLAYAIRWLELGDGQPRPPWGPDPDGPRRRG